MLWFVLLLCLLEIRIIRFMSIMWLDDPIILFARRVGGGVGGWWWWSGGVGVVGRG